MPPSLAPVPNKKAAPLDGVLETYFLLQPNLVLMKQSRSSAPKPRHLVPAKHFYCCVFLVSRPLWSWGKLDDPKAKPSNLSPQECFYASNINLGKVCHRPTPLN